MVKQLLRLIAAMILLLYVNSVIVVTKSICHDTRALVKLILMRIIKTALLTWLPCIDTPRVFFVTMSATVLLLKLTLVKSFVGLFTPRNQL